jgi:hypothetical protein
VDGHHTRERRRETVGVGRVGFLGGPGHRRR